MPRLMDERLARSLYKQVQPWKRDGRTRPVSLTYQRDYFFHPRLGSDVFPKRAGWLRRGGVDPGETVLIVGSAFGYLGEALFAGGITDVYGIDSGSWYWDAANNGEWATGAKARTANDWIGSGTEQASIALLSGAPVKFDWVIDEDAAPAHSDAELPAFIAGLEDRSTGPARIVHLITPVADTGPGDSSQNWKSMTDWKAVAPTHTWVGNGTVE